LDQVTEETNDGISEDTLRKVVKIQAWWCTSGIPELRKLRQEDQEFKASLDYTARPCLLKNPIEKK
jgi:hypothetical protein